MSSTARCSTSSAACREVRREDGARHRRGERHRARDRARPRARRRRPRRLRPERGGARGDCRPAASSGTRCAVFGLSEGLREELRPHGIAVTPGCPGIINTPITTTPPMRGPLAPPEARAALVELYRRRNYGPERVAANVLKAIARRRAVAPISPEAWVMYLMKRLSPGLTARLNRALQARMERQMGPTAAPPRAPA